ncbi:hypothetical protein OBBRIDRAFT_69678 [Obba rivulosa]|uniref:Uncharacterized protein n=1 Tax=Obba rivulosa TaxID=1052685 RepID=A0A8E2AV80_9APHY|nr:hypothetical protein OBBRIDRAFT_69678 [Obba rivulosa]
MDRPTLRYPCYARGLRCQGIHRRFGAGRRSLTVQRKSSMSCFGLRRSPHPRCSRPDIRVSKRMPDCNRLLDIPGAIAVQDRHYAGFFPVPDLAKFITMGSRLVTASCPTVRLHRVTRYRYIDWLVRCISSISVPAKRRLNIGAPPVIILSFCLCSAVHGCFSSRGHCLRHDPNRSVQMLPTKTDM